MFKLPRFIKAMALFASHQAWVEQPHWTEDDAFQLAKFYATPTGIRLRAMLANVVVRQQAQAVSHKSPQRLMHEAGYCAGQRGLVAVLESLADKDQFSEQGDTDADPATTQEAS